MFFNLCTNTTIKHLIYWFEATLKQFSNVKMLLIIYDHQVY